MRLVSVSFCWSHIHSARPQPLRRRENRIKGIITKSCNSPLKYCFLISLFCQSHSTALTPELDQTQGKKRLSLHLALGRLFPYLHMSWKKTYRNVSAVAAFFQENPISPLRTIINFAPLHTAQVLIKELIYSIPQQRTTAWKVPVCCISSNSG